MKKYIIVLLALALLLCAGCKKQEPAPTEAPVTVPATEAVTEPSEAPTEPEETTVPPTEETIPVPELRVGTALADETPAILDILMRGDTVDVVGEYDEDHYVIKIEPGYGLVKKELLRPEGEAAYEVWTGYAYWNTEVYDNRYLSGEPIQTLQTNTKVEVLEDLGYCYVVQIEDASGFVNKSTLATRPISGGNSTGADGGEIVLQFQGGIELLAAVEQSGDVTGQATVLADGTEVVLGYFNRGEEIHMVAEEGFAEDREGYVTVYLEGLYAYVPQWLVVTEETEAYEAWDGYSVWNGAVYDNFHLMGDPIVKLYTNAKVHVIAEVGDCYLVEVNEVTGYMHKDAVSKSMIPTGGSGAEWSPPAL